MELSKLSKSPSLLRSPTIKSGINSLSSLDELDRSHEPSKSRLGCLPQTSGNRDGRAIGHGYAYLRERLQLLVPPSIIVAVPFVWWCVKAGPSYGLKWLSLDIVPWYWFNVSASFVLFVAVVLSIHLAVPHLSGRALVTPTWGVFRDTFGQSWHFVNSSCLQPLGSVLQSGDKKEDGWKVRSQSQGTRSPRSPGSSKPKKNQGYGEGVQAFSNGDVYEGEFYRGKFSGSGVYYFYKSGRYEGNWVDGKYDGHGVETWARGSRYRGQYRQGMREGYGIYRFYSGDVYSGHWSNGQSHGCGMQTCGDGSCYVGEFKWGVKHGVGCYHFRNGDTYAGEYFADKMHGYGVYKFANGHRYEGSWHDGRKQGLGIYTFRNGDTHAGHWHLGTLESRSTQVPNASSPVTVNHSKVLNAVQEARKAAQKGMDVERVDDRVKRAVALANQAANAARVAAVKAVHR
ncbi:hypothetical protein M758_7G181900 [Ceratodon purpureus]|nr:hypothetical protein M758_7G181900 [Ceratodon purpureus]